MRNLNKHWSVFVNIYIYIYIYIFFFFFFLTWKFQYEKLCYVYNKAHRLHYCV